MSHFAGQTVSAAHTSGGKKRAASGAYSAIHFQRGRDIFAESLGSARVIAPLLLEWFPCRSVLDLGCGPGTLQTQPPRDRPVGDYLRSAMRAVSSCVVGPFSTTVLPPLVMFYY